MEGSGQVHVPTALTLRKNTSSHCRGGWIGPRTSLDGYGEQTILCVHRTPRTYHAVPSRYTDYATPEPQNKI